MSKPTRKKTSDKDIKAFFRGYHDSKGRMKVLLQQSIGRHMTLDEKAEYEQLKFRLKVMEEIVDTLEPFQAKVVRAVYIEHQSLFNISLEVNFCYEHVSWVKVLAGNNIRNLLSGGNILRDEMSIALTDVIHKVLAEAGAEETKDKNTQQ